MPQGAARGDDRSCSKTSILVGMCSSQKRRADNGSGDESPSNLDLDVDDYLQKIDEWSIQFIEDYAEREGIKEMKAVSGRGT